MPRRRKKSAAQKRKQTRERVRRFRAKKKAQGYTWGWVKTPPKYSKERI